MTLLFMDGFEHYAIGDIQEKWSQLFQTAITRSISSVGRRGSNGLSINGSGSSSYGYLIKGLAQNDTHIIGIAVYFTSTLAKGSTAHNGIVLTETGTYQLGAYVETNGSMTIRRGGPTSTVLSQTSGGVITAGKWLYVELKATIHNTTGSYDLVINGISETSGSGKDTQVSANAYADSAQIGFYPGAAGRFIYYDDIYICDDEGSTNNDLLGDVKVESILPDGAGTSTDFTASAGSNYDCVNEAAPNDDTDYVSETTAGDHDSYSYGDLVTTSGTVFGLQTLANARKDDAGVRVLKALIRSGGADYTPGGSLSLGDSYQYHMDIFEQDPDTTAAWTIAGVNAAEFGPKLES